MERTKIEYADITWNPVTGCHHGCDYCYARKIAHRFAAGSTFCKYGCGTTVELEEPYFEKGEKRIAYPADFIPTLYRYRMNVPQKKESSKTIFVCSMGDLFGEWVPQDWINEVIEACRQAPQHQYLFLTKNPIRYSIWRTEKYPDIKTQFDANFWLGCTFTGTERLHGDYIGKPGDPYFSLSNGTNFWYLYTMSGNLCPGGHKFLSIEPMLSDVCNIEDERQGGKLL